jgi:hypothetical protein
LLRSSSAASAFFRAALAASSATVASLLPVDSVGTQGTSSELPEPSSLFITLSEPASPEESSAAAVSLPEPPAAVESLPACPPPATVSSVALPLEAPPSFGACSPGSRGSPRPEAVAFGSPVEEVPLSPPRD